MTHPREDQPPRGGAGGRTLWCARAWLEDRGIVDGVRAVVGGDGIVASLETGVSAGSGDTELNGVVFPAAANAHSHAFHRVLRGRTHAGEPGSFWTWRESMYAAARQLTPELYEELATAVFAEMVVTGWTSVAEFHYVHHRPGGSAYGSPSAQTPHRTNGAEGPDEQHAMELALARAAVAAGIRLTLLDTCYLAGGFGLPPGPEQLRFSDGSAEQWLRRFTSLRAAVAA